MIIIEISWISNIFIVLSVLASNQKRESDTDPSIYNHLPLALCYDILWAVRI